MDESTASAACAVTHGDTTEAEGWFRAVGAAWESSGEDGDLSAFGSALAASAADEGAPAATVEEFLAYLAGQPSPLDVIAGMHAEGPVELLAAYQAWAAEAGAADPAPAEDDPAAWNGYLATNGSAWDGTEASWAAFREWFAYHAHAAGVGDAAEAFLAHADGAQDRIDVFATYGVLIDPSPGAPQDGEADAPFDPAGEEVAEAGTVTVEDAVETVAASVIAEFRAEHPEFADLSDEDLRALLTEIVAEEARAVQPA